MPWVLKFCPKSNLIGGASLFRAAKVFIHDEIEREISKRINARMDELEKSLRKQAVLKQTTLYFYQPDGNGMPSSEFSMVESQIPNSSFRTNLDENLLKSSNVVVLDLVNSGLDEAEKGQEIAKKLATELPYWSTLVLYTPTNRSPVFNALIELRKRKRTVDFSTSNMKVTLMERVIGSAIASAALKS